MKPLKLPVFTLLSGIGWCIDFAIFNYLVTSGHAHFVANAISATAGVSFVLVTARRWIFRDHVEKLSIVVTKYIGWNIVAIGVASLLVMLIANGLELLDLSVLRDFFGNLTGIVMTDAVMIPNIAKLLVTPITMYANFVAVGWIIERRFSFY